VKKEGSASALQERSWRGEWAYTYVQSPSSSTNEQGHAYEYSSHYFGNKHHREQHSDVQTDLYLRVDGGGVWASTLVQGLLSS
jgi:hypothetical protein